jgi:hypothetical protein
MKGFWPYLGATYKLCHIRLSYRNYHLPNRLADFDETRYGRPTLNLISPSIIFIRFI